MADGVAPADLYPLDIPRALAKLDTIKDASSGGSQVHRAGVDRLRRGRRFHHLERLRLLRQHTDGKPVETAEPASWTADYFVIPKGSPNKDAAMEFTAWATCANNNAAVSAHIPYGPTNAYAEPNAAVVPDPAVSNVNESTAYFDDGGLVNNFDAIDGPFQTRGHPVS